MRAAEIRAWIATTASLIGILGALITGAWAVHKICSSMDQYSIALKTNTEATKKNTSQLTKMVDAFHAMDKRVTILENKID